MAADQQQLKVDGREVLFPPADLTMGDMADAENYFGVEWTQPERSGMRLTLAMLFIAIRRVDPTVTVDDVRAIDPDILNQLQGADASPPVGSNKPRTDSSEHDSPNTSGISEHDPSPTGDLGSGTGTHSVLATSPP